VHPDQDHGMPEVGINQARHGNQQLAGERGCGIAHGLMLPDSARWPAARCRRARFRFRARFRSVTTVRLVHPGARIGRFFAGNPAQ
jgi:hypothetical protein